MKLCWINYFGLLYRGTVFYFGWKVGEAAYPYIRDVVKEGWDEAMEETK